MPIEAPPEPSPYRVTLFFGPEPVDGRVDVQVCVFNVKKRSWKAGVQVSVEIGLDQLTSLQNALGLRERLARALAAVTEEERPAYDVRSAECFAQALCRCKLDLRMRSGLVQENQRISADELASELTEDAMIRREYVFSYILTELDLAPHSSAPS